MSTFIVTSSGAEYHVAGPYQRENGRTNGAITIELIAHSLSQINRFTGHANRPYSVAEHSLLCVDIAARMQLDPWVQLCVLLHDAHEAYVGDVSSPVKWEVGQAWNSFEDQHSRAVRRYFGLHERFRRHEAQIKECDLVALATERRDLVPYTPGASTPWAILDRPGLEVATADWVDLNSAKRKQCDWTEWRELFLVKFHELKRASAEWFAANVREHQP